MSELIAVVIRKGQVTIPAELRRALDLKHGDLVAFSLPDRRTGAATVRRAPTRRESVVERTAGMLASAQPAASPEEEKAAAELAWAERAFGHDFDHSSTYPASDEIWGTSSRN